MKKAEIEEESLHSIVIRRALRIPALPFICKLIVFFWIVNLLYKTYDNSSKEYNKNLKEIQEEISLC